MSMRWPGAIALMVRFMKLRAGTRCTMALTVVSTMVGCLRVARASLASAAMRRATMSEPGPTRSYGTVSQAGKVMTRTFGAKKDSACSSCSMRRSSRATCSSVPGVEPDCASLTSCASTSASSPSGTPAMVRAV